MIIYGSVCSGLEAATVAWKPLGWELAWLSEIDPFACAILEHHYPAKNLGDIYGIGADKTPINLLVGGTPCQGFSVTGKRKGLDDARSNLALQYVQILQIYKPRWFVWENVPGVLTSGKGMDFGEFLKRLAESGYGFAWRILDARYFGVPQRRRRVFIVGHSGGNWKYPAAVLFDGCTNSTNRKSIDKIRGQTTHSEERQNLRMDGGCDSEIRRGSDAYVTGGAGRGGGRDLGAYSWRRLTSVEWERLMGLPDNYTLVPYKGKLARDNHRRKVIGNSFAVPILRWIGERIDFVDSLDTERKM